MLARMPHVPMHTSANITSCNAMQTPARYLSWLTFPRGMGASKWKVWPVWGALIAPISGTSPHLARVFHNHATPSSPTHRIWDCATASIVHVISTSSQNLVQGLYIQMQNSPTSCQSFRQIMAADFVTDIVTRLDPGEMWVHAFGGEEAPEEGQHAVDTLIPPVSFVQSCQTRCVVHKSHHKWKGLRSQQCEGNDGRQQLQEIDVCPSRTKLPDQRLRCHSMSHIDSSAKTYHQTPAIAVERCLLGVPVGWNVWIWRSVGFIPYCKECIGVEHHFEAGRLKRNHSRFHVHEQFLQSHKGRSQRVVELLMIHIHAQAMCSSINGLCQGSTTVSKGRSL